MPPHRDDALLVLQAPVVEHAVHLVVVGRVPDLRDQDLDLERLQLLREDPPERLRVGVRDRLRGDVLAAVGVAAEIGQTNPGDAEVLELVVLAHRGERDAVVDLADLVQRFARVLGDDEDPRLTLDRDDRLAARNALARVVRAVLHHLFG